MDKQKQIIISHPNGNANTRGAIYGINRKGMLYKYVTSIAVFSSGFWHTVSKMPGLGMFARKKYNDDIQDKTNCFPIKELGRQICSKLKLNIFTRHETGVFCTDKECQYIDNKTADLLDKSSVDAVYCYEDVAIQTFIKAKERNIKCIYDLPIGYWRYMRQLLSEELKKNPDWAATLGGFNDSEEKTLRKDRELGLADKIYVASTFTKRSLGLYPNNLAEIEVIPYGFPNVNRKRIHRNLSNGKISLLYVGGLSQRKGIAYLFKALEGLNDFELTVIGTGNIDGCQALKDSLGKCKYLGTMSHDKVLEEMAKHDIMVFPSLFEGFGLVITESMSQGTPVITTDRTCGPDIITDGKDGWIIEAGSDEAIRHKLIYLSDNRDEITTAGKNCLVTASMRPWRKYEEELATSVSKFLNE